MSSCALGGSLPSRLALIVGVLLLQAGCEQVDVITVDVARVELSPPDAVVRVMDTVHLHATVLGNGGRPLTGRLVEWSSLDPEIAQVGPDGVVTGLAPGVATIRASSEGVTGNATVRVTSAPSIQLTPAVVEFVGVQSGASPGDRILSVANAGDGTLGSLTAGVRYVAGAAGWLSASVSSPTAPASIVLSVNQAGLPAGTYSAAVDVTSPDAANSPASATVQLTILEPQPAIGLGATSISFAGAQGGANPAEQSFGVTNAGRGTLSGLSVTVEYVSGQPSNWLEATLSGTTAPATLVLRAITGSLAAGTYAANVRIASDVAQNSPQIVTVTFTVGAAQPVIVRNPAQLAFAGRGGEPSPSAQVVEIGNAGGGALAGLSTAVTYSPGEPGGWLEAALSSTEAPATLTVSATTGALPAGTYSSIIFISAPGAVNDPQHVSVTFAVAPAAAPPAIAVSTATVSFAAIRGGNDPAAVAVAITNSGGGELTDLTSSIIYPAGQPSDWLTATLSDASAPATLTLSASPGALQVGTWSATVRLASARAGNSPVDIGVTLVITEAAPTAPSAPGGLAATAISTSRIDVAWSAATGTVTEYRLERKTGQAGSYAVVATLGSTALGHEDTGLSAGTTYVYRVRACNEAACSPYSAEAAATTQTPPPPAPSAPTDFSASGVSTSRVDLTWTHTGLPLVNRFEIQRALQTSPTAFADLVSTAPEARSHADTGLPAGTGYVYRLRACNLVGCSPWAEASAATHAIAETPAVPGNVTASVQSRTEVVLSWTAPGGQTRYEIRRRTGRGGPWTFSAEVPGNETSFRDTGLTAGTYQYQIRACGINCSEYSAPIDVTLEAGEEGGSIAGVAGPTISGSQTLRSRRAGQAESFNR
jgi:hypothetical protein